MKEGQTRLSFQLTLEERAKIAEEAARLEVSMSQVMRIAVDYYLGERKPDA